MKGESMGVQSDCGIELEFTGDWVELVRDRPPVEDWSVAVEHLGELGLPCGNGLVQVRRWPHHPVDEPRDVGAVAAEQLGERPSIPALRPRDEDIGVGGNEGELRRWVG